ncbi:MAG: ATP-binding cassette domain-containing protein [Treponema sp.]|nr:ATP-binding cassette domain-containing protein [Treponema sp.]
MDVLLEHATKKYIHKTVLDDVSLSFKGGMIHALLGENGAGKSTIAAILSGARGADYGTLLIDGNEAHFAVPRDAVRAGIACVAQRPLLADSISVQENILLGAEYNCTGKKMKKAHVIRAAAAIQQTWAPQLDVHARVANIGGDERFYTSLIAALVKEPRMLILDEPSALLDWEQRRSLYANMRTLAQNGMNVVVITHSMQEAALYTDTVTVLRNGKVAEYYESSESFGKKVLDAHTHCIGAGRCGAQDNRSFAPQKGERASKACERGERLFPEINNSISFEHVTVRPKNRPALFDVSFTAKSGEVTLVTGLQESGLGTLENALMGMENARVLGTCKITDAHKTEIINLKSGRLSPQFLRYNTTLHTALIPSNRTYRASNPSLSIEQLVCAMHNSRDARAYTAKIIKKAEVSIEPHEKASSLSGGMLQRLILAREFDVQPLLLIACEPLQGLDVAAAERTAALLSSLAEQGCIVLVLAASDFPEARCHAVYRLESGMLHSAAPPDSTTTATANGIHMTSTAQQSLKKADSARDAHQQRGTFLQEQQHDCKRVV